jgi:DNA-binding LytR/AlgR family response regulator
MLINCIIIDDEPLARKGLKEYIGDVDFLRLTGEYDTPLKVLDKLKEEHIQLIFLDIQMPGLTGLDFLKTLQNPPLVIIATAYPQYALEGFDLNVLDYLVKPVPFNRFVKSAMKARDYFAVRAVDAAPLPENQKVNHIFIKTDNKLVKIFYDDILFIEALQNYVTIYTTGKKYITYLTFKSIEEILPPGSFLKIHKSYIIHLGKIEGIEGNDIIIGQHKVPVSRANKNEAMQKILNGNFLKR